MNNLLRIVQRVLEVTPIRGKGRLAELVFRGKATEITCHPLSGVTIHLNPQQRIERLMWAGAYEPDLVRMLKSFLKPGMVFLDLGANVGYFSAIAAALVGVHGRVFAFEPAPNCFTRLQRNLSVFPQAFVYNCAASDRPGQTGFYLHSKEDGWGSLFSDQDLRERIEVNTIRLDDWAQDAAIERVDFLKIDIEGGEYRALLGAQALLKRFRPLVIAELNTVCLSRDQRTPDDVLDLLAEAQYCCQRTEDGVIARPRAAPAVVEP
jgi:FkbM family methyltransferase